MKSLFSYMMTGLVVWTTLVIWAVTLPSSILLALALVSKSLSWITGTENLLSTLLDTGTLLHWSIVLLPLNLLCLYLFVRNTTDTEHGRIMKFLVGIPTRVYNSIFQKNLEPSTNPTDKPPTQMS